MFLSKNRSDGSLTRCAHKSSPRVSQAVAAVVVTASAPRAKSAGLTSPVASSQILSHRNNSAKGSLSQQITSGQKSAKPRALPSDRNSQGSLPWPREAHSNIRRAHHVRHFGQFLCRLLELVSGHKKWGCNTIKCYSPKDAPPIGLEPITLRLTVECSAN